MTRRMRMRGIHMGEVIFGMSRGTSSKVWPPLPFAEHDHVR